MASRRAEEHEAKINPTKSKEQVRSLNNLPLELFLKIIKEIVVIFGLRKAVKLRILSRLFYDSITAELCHDFITRPYGVVETGIRLSKKLRYPSNNTSSLPTSHQYAAPERLIDIGRSLAGKLLLSLMDHDANHKILTPIRQALRVSQSYDHLGTDESEYRNKHSVVFESLSESLCWNGDRDSGGRRGVSIINSPDFDPTATEFTKKQPQIDLSVAIIANNIPMVTELIKSDAVDLNSGNTFFDKPLPIAVQHKRTNIIKLLIENGSKWLDNGDLWSLKPTAIPALIDLHVQGAISLAPEPAISALNLSNYEIDLIAFDAVASTNTNTFLLLMDLIKTREFPWNMYDRLLSKAIKYGNDAVVRWVLDHGADTFKDSGNDCSKYRVSPLRAAAKSGQSKIVRMLLDRGEKDTAPGGFANSTALGLAASHGYEDIIEMLLGHDVENTSKFSFTNIQPGEHPHILRMLLERGFCLGESAGRSWISSMGDLFLRDAIKSGNLCMVQELVKQGVAVNNDDLEKSPVLYASMEGRKEISSFLKLSGGKEIDLLKPSLVHFFNRGDTPRKQAKTESELFWTLGRY